MQTAENMIIIGSGPAAHTAAVYAARAELKPLMFEGFDAAGAPGGQLMTTTEVENYPGFPDGITGPELMARMRAQSARFGTRILTEDVGRVDLKARPILVEAEGKTYRTRTLILATGASAKYLGLAAEARLLNRGVSACATCDGALPMFRNQALVVVGGGDTAMEEALFLSRFASHVHVVHRRDTFRASAIMQARARRHPKISFETPYEVEDVLGEDHVTGVRLLHRGDGSRRELAAAGLFVAIGHQPNTSLVTDQLAADPAGYIKTRERSTACSEPGVFVCGDVQDPTYRQAITAAGSGCQAAIEAERWLHAQQEEP